MRDASSQPREEAGGPAAHDPFVLIEAGAGRTLRFRDPVDRVTIHSLGDVAGALARLGKALRDGFHIAGYAAYEAGHAFEPRLRGLERSGRGPLLQFGIFHEPDLFDWSRQAGDGWLDRLEPLWTVEDYARRFARVIAHIRAGDAYQVNLTFPLHGRWHGDPLALYAALRRHQPAPYGAYVALGAEHILSFSPELFFATDRDAIRVRPMKGTAPRGGTPEEDDRFAASLAASEKNRAENLMIVDLLRNDLSRIATVGSVAVTDLFTVERHPTVLQMTSGVEARLRGGIGLPELFASLFPCGSVTGAPKIKAMEIIHDLEDGPRGVYCGSIGTVGPDGAARFSVAIRTATLAPDGGCVFNVGSGVVFDSDARAEYEECLLKSRFLRQAIRPSA